VQPKIKMYNMSNGSYDNLLTAQLNMEIVHKAYWPDM